MNKLNRNIRKIILIVMLLILSTTITYKVDALTMNYTILSTSTNPYYYCSEHGAPLPAANTANTYYQNGGAPDDVGATGSVLEENIANGLANLADGENIVSESIYSALGGTEYTQAELSEFTCVGDSYANAIETYILLNGDGYYGYVNTGSKWQELWWGTPAGQGYVHTTNGTQEVNINPIEDSINGMAVKGFNDNENKGILAKGSIIDEFKNMKTDVKAIEISGTSTRFAANEANSDEATQTSENENKSETNRANAFATYIEAVTGKDNAICGKDGFDIKYKPEWVTGKVAEDSTNSDKQIDYDNPTIAVDGNKFIVGPFAIDYIHAYVGDEVFSEITKMELVLGKADGTEEILVIGGTEDNSDKFTLSKQSSGVFPEGKETFYLVFDNIENVTQIKDLKVSFRYLNAKGKYELWDGTYTVKNTTVEPSTETDDEGNVTYKLTVSTSTTVKNAQTVSKKSSSDTTEKWYETVQLNRDIDKNRGEISIKKVITDIDGKEIDYSTLGDGEKRAFYFRLKVDEAINSGTDIIKVMAGQAPVQSKVYFWNIGDKVPTFELIEIPKDDYTLEKIEGKDIGTFANGTFKGEFKVNSTSALNIVATNILEPHKGNLNINKIAEDKIIKGETYSIKGNSYKVKVTITPASDRGFKYNGVDYINKSLEVELTLVAGGDAVKLPYDVIWYGDKAPAYKVEEIPSPDANLVSIIPKEGNLVSQKDANTSGEPEIQAVTVKNGPVIEKGKIHIIKTVTLNIENSNTYDRETLEKLKLELEEKIKKQTYEFKIKVDGEKEISTGKIEAKRENNTYIWEYTSGEYLWQYGKNPGYTIEEINVPEGTQFVKATINGVETPINNNTITGKLVSNATNDYKVDNNLINEVKIGEHKGTLNLRKIIDTKDLQDNDYKFKLELDAGTFFYNGKLYTATKENPIRFVTDKSVATADNQYIVLHIDPEKFESDVWSSNEIKWYDYLEKPHFIIEEYALGQNIKSIDIQPGEGYVSEGTPIEIKAKNNGYESKVGKLHIIKTLEGAKNYDPKEIEALTFTFKISINRYDANAEDKYGDIDNTFDLILKAELKGDTYVWEGETNPITWKENELPPKFKVEEIDIPDGITFSVANAEDHDTIVNGKIVEGILSEIGEKESDADNNLNGSDIYYKNKCDTDYRGVINLTKIIEDSDKLKNQDYKFTIKVTGTFDYVHNGQKTHYDNKTIILTNEDASGVTETDDKYVVIHIDNNTTSTWNSGEFIWKDIDNPPTYEIAEKIENSDIKATITPEKGALSGIINVTAKNDLTRTKEANIRIVKKLENISQLTDEEIKSLIFKFNISVDGYKDTIVSLTPKKENGEWKVESANYKYTWKENQAAPKFTVQEIDIPSGTKFKSVTVDGTSDYEINNQLVKGTLSEGTTITFNYINEEDAPTYNEGKLVIDKRVTKGSLEGKEFLFKVTLRGTFIYNNSEKYANEELRLGTESRDGELVVIVKGGEKWQSESIKWEAGQKAPTYTIEELNSDIAENISVINGTGEIQVGTTEGTVATFTNAPKQKGGYIEITKQLTEGQISSDTFTFEISVDGYAPYMVTLKANETYKSERYTWDATEEAPKYTVKEIKKDGYEITSIKDTTNNKEGTITDGIGTISGSLSDNASIKIVVQNKQDINSGKFTVKKEVIADTKYVEDATTKKFKITATITGNYRYEDNEGEHSVNGSQSFNFELKADEVWTSPKIIWYGDNAPTVTVKEDLTDETYRGWKNIGISNNNVVVSDGLEIVVTNEYRVQVIIDLTIELAGKVWNDIALNPNDKNTENSVPNGRIDPVETGINGVEVYVYEVTENGERKLASVYQDLMDAEITQPIITSNGGHWNAPRVKIPTQNAKYDVEFVYDGQTYEPTKFLALSKDNLNKLTGSSRLDYSNYENISNEEKASKYMKETTERRDYFADTSMALDYDREDVDNRIGKVYGNTSINGKGETIGTVDGSIGVNNINYTSNASTSALQTRVVSKVKTTNNDGIALDLFKTKARTSVGTLKYPFDEKIHLSNVDTKLTDYGTKITYTYSATYNYTLNINLGLINREEADIEATKDLVSAKVVVNDRLLNYKFNKLADIGSDVYSRSFEDSRNLSYELGLYRTDYYYRAEIYKANMGRDYDAVEKFYKDIGTSIEDTELEVYLQYKISLYNAGTGKYKIVVNSVDDYYDSTFRLITENTDKYVKTIDGQIQEGLTQVAREPYIEINRNQSPIEWVTTESNIKGSDGITYNKMTSTLPKIELGSGEKAEIYVTFAVDKDTIEGVQDAIELGNKSNVAEIASYSTYYSDKKDGNGNLMIAGKIDRDSAPANINIENYNTKDWYEDDTDSAPVLNLKLVDDERKVTGRAWEDKGDENGTSIGNGIYDEGEALIGGLTTELVEKVQVKTGNEYIDYDFVWPTNKGLDQLGGMTLEYLTGFDSTIETSRENVQNGLNVGEYSFKSVPAGNYVVRFLYGNNKAKLDDTFNITGNPIALKSDGTSYSENGNILIANYDKDAEGKTTAIYNGHDYKATIYQVGFASKDTETGFVNNEWHDLDNIELRDTRVSDARDSEARRLETIANSQTITNVNGTVLSTANDKLAGHSDLYEDYYMYADTAKLNMVVEKLGEAVNVEEVDGTSITNQNGTLQVDKKIAEYTISNIDCGLTERPENALILDKEIESIKLTTNDGKVIFNALYDIEYNLKDSASGEDKILAEVKREGHTKYLVANLKLKDTSVGTDVLQALDKKENKLDEIKNNSGIQNFRFINIEETILQGTTVEINYRLTALNSGEIDYTSSTLANVSGTTKEIRAKILELASQVAEESVKSGTVNNTPKLGKYLGTTYYTGEVKNDQIVTTKVRQVVDYVDNDAVFSAQYNQTTNHSWRNTTVLELTGNGYKDERLLDEEITATTKLIDDDGISYITDQKNNVILSIDTENTTGELNNKDFEVKLQPINLDANNNYNSNIGLTVTRTVAAQDDADNLTYDNLAEIVKFENSVGRRDITAIPGNANPKLGEFPEGLKERDSSATELVTFTPPTGLEEESVITAQALIITILALGIMAVGIVVIKKKVLQK